MGRTYVIAEAGINHNGNLDLAKKMIDIAAYAGADAVKFQTFETSELVTDYAPSAAYQQLNVPKVNTQKQLLKSLELRKDQFIVLSNYAEDREIDFISTAFDINSLRFIDRSLSPPTLKISSGDLTNGPFLLEHARTHRNIILSTGMANLDEIKEALSVLAYGYLEKTNPTTRLELERIFETDAAKLILKEKVTLLHCVTEYPTRPTEANLRAVATLLEIFPGRVGYSDHTLGIYAPLIAVALGASVIEKHFTLDVASFGPDHIASLEPTGLNDMVKAIREVEALLGDGEKRPQSSEIRNMAAARRSLVAACDIARGEIFTENNIAIKRPGIGRHPMDYWDLLGKVCAKPIKADEYIP